MATSGAINNSLEKFRDSADKLIKQAKAKAKNNEVTAKVLEGLGSKPQLGEILLEYYNAIELALSVAKTLVTMNNEAVDSSKTAKEHAKEIDLINKQLKAENNELETVNDKLQEYKNVFDKIDEHLTDWKGEIVGKGSSGDIQALVQEEVKKTLPAVLKDVVTQVTDDKKFTKTWAKVVEQSQIDLKEEANKTFKNSKVQKLSKYIRK